MRRRLALLVPVLLLAPLATGARAQRNNFDFEAIVPSQIRAVEKGLRYLAATQVKPEGYWIADVGYKLNTDYRIISNEKPHVGVTSLALMAFLAGGHVPGRGEYGDVVERGLEWILSRVNQGDGGQDDGFISAHKSRMYSHAFAALFLAEVYGMYFPADESKRERVRDALQKAIRFTYNTQNGEGGWRYKPLAPDSDMSITVCQIMALRAANNAGLAVPQNKIEKAKEYVDRSAVRGAYQMQWGGPSTRGGFKYQLTHSSRVSFPLTAAGVTTLYGAGVYDHSNQIIQDGIQYLSINHRRFTDSWGLGGIHGWPRGHYFFYYGHYYSVQAMYIRGGERWKDYFSYTRDMLLKMQDPDTGTWPNDVGPGEAFSTAVATLVLEIPFGYLPIFQR